MPLNSTNLKFVVSIDIFIINGRDNNCPFWAFVLNQNYAKMERLFLAFTLGLGDSDFFLMSKQ